MDTIPSEMLRGHVDTIILLSLLDCDKHTNQIKEEIEGRVEGQFELKQGTFYSCLQRIVGQGYVTEYRSSSSDGKRRKFYQLTEKGKAYIEDNKDKWLFSRSLIDTLIQVPQDETQIESITDYEQKKRENASKNVLVEPEQSLMPNVDEKELVKKIDVIDKLGSKIEQLELQLERFASNSSIISTANVTQGEQNVKVNSSTNEESNVSNEETKDENILEHSDREIDIEEYLRMTQLEKIAMANANPPASPTPQQSENGEKSLDLIDNSEENYVEQNSAVDGELINESEIEEDQTNIRFVSQPIQNQSVQNQNENIIPVEQQQQNLFLQEQNLFHQENQQYQNQQIYYQSTQQQKQQINDSLDSAENSTRDYKSILDKLFPEINKHSQEEEIIDEMFGSVFGNMDNPRQEKENYEVESANEEIVENVSEDETVEQEEVLFKHKIKPSRIKKQMKKLQMIENLSDFTQSNKSFGYDFSDIYKLADQEGFKVRASSSSVTKENNGKILVNKLNASSSLSFFFLLMLEVFILAFTTRSVAELPIQAYLIFICVLAIFPVLCFVTYFIDPNKKTESITSFKNVVEFSFVIVLNLIIIVLVYAFLINVDFTNVRMLTLNVFYPILFILNLPIYFFIKYLKLNNRRYFS